MGAVYNAGIAQTQDTPTPQDQYDASGTTVDDIISDAPAMNVNVAAVGAIAGIVLLAWWLD